MQVVWSNIQEKKNMESQYFVCMIGELVNAIRVWIKSRVGLLKEETCVTLQGHEQLVDVGVVEELASFRPQHCQASICCRMALESQTLHPEFLHLKDRHGLHLGLERFSLALYCFSLPVGGQNTWMPPSEPAELAAEQTLRTGWKKLTSSD